MHRDLKVQPWPDKATNLLVERAVVLEKMCQLCNIVGRCLPDACHCLKFHGSLNDRHSDHSEEEEEEAITGFRVLTGCEAQGSLGGMNGASREEKIDRTKR